MANETQSADQLLSTWAAPVFANEEPSEAEFRRWRRQMGPCPESSYTYFAGPETRFLIKIGRSIEPYRRARELSAEVSYPVRVLATMRGDFEACYHDLFAAHRAFGEWFEPHHDILAEIDRLNDGPLA